MKIFTTSLDKEVSYDLCRLIELKAVKNFIIASAKKFWPRRPGRLQSGREHTTWSMTVVLYVVFIFYFFLFLLPNVIDLAVNAAN